MKYTLTFLTTLLLAPLACLHAADAPPVRIGFPATMREAAQPAKRSPGSPKYEDICFSPRTTSAGKRDVVEVAKAFHATRIEWLYVDERDGRVLQRLRDLGISLGLGLTHPRDTTEKKTGPVGFAARPQYYTQGRILDIDGKVLDGRSSMHDPATAELVKRWLRMLGQFGVQRIHRDEPDWNYRELGTTMKRTLTLLTATLLASFAVSPAAHAPETGAESTKPKPKAGTAPIEFGYRPEGMTMWDPWFVAHEGQVHLFHLQRLAPGSKRTAAEADHIGHATSRDLIQWTEQPLTVGPGEQGGIEDLQPWTGCAVVKDGVFHLFYTMRSSREQARNQHIGLATSRDLVNWQRHPGNPVIAPDPRWYVHEGKPEPDKKVGCRDMKIVRDPAGNGWIGFFAATVPAEEEAEAACIALTRSKDLIHWEQMPPAFAPKRYGEIEAHDVFPLGGKWWMTCLTSHGHGNRGIFADPNVVRGTIVAVADKPEGPYREPVTGYALLGGDLTAGNTVSTVEFEGRRYAFFQEGQLLSPPLALNVTPEGRLRLMWSDRQNAWRGASLLPEKLPQPVSIRTHVTGGVTAGKWELAADRSYRGKSHTGWQVADLGFGASDMEVEATVTLKSGIAAGFVLRANRSAPYPERDFVFALDARNGCVFGASLTMFSPMNRRQFKVEPNRAYHVRLCARSDRYELYVDGELILHGGFPKEFVRKQPGLGLFVDRGETVIEKLAVYQQTPSPAKTASSK